MSTPTAYRFTGQRREAGLGGPAGLYDYEARYYDPYLGRFIQADTMVPSLGDPQDINRYTYARNSPVRYADPTGHWIDEMGGLEEHMEDVYPASGRGGDPILTVFYGPQHAAEVWDVAVPMRVARETEWRQASTFPSDWDIALALGSPIIAPAGVLLLAGGVEAAAPVVVPLLLKAAPSAAVSAAGDVVGQLLTTGNWKPEKTLVAGGVGLVSPFIPGDGIVVQIVCGVLLADAQYALGNIAAGESVSWEGFFSATLAGGMASILQRTGPETFWRSLGIEIVSNVNQSRTEQELRDRYGYR